MSVQLLIGAASAAAFGPLGLGLTTGATGFLIGSTAAGVLGIGAQNIKGPRLSDLKAPQASYGSVLPCIEGMVRTTGVIAWQSDKREIKTKTRGGKGGPTSTTYTYEVDLLIILSENELAGLRRVWKNGKLIWSAAGDATDATLQASAASKEWGAIRFYTGDAAQLPDPTYEAEKGVGNCPAYRGRAYVFIESLNLGGSDQIPLLSFEVFSHGTAGGLDTYEFLEDFSTYAADLDPVPPWSAGTSGLMGVVAIGDDYTYGINGRNNFGAFGAGDQTNRNITGITAAAFIQFDFRLTNLGDDDAISLRFSQTSPSYSLEFLPRRELSVDAGGRPILYYTGGSSYLGSTALLVDTWYRAEIICASGSNASSIAITLRDGTPITTGNFTFPGGPTWVPVSMVVTEDDTSASSITSGTRYTNIKIYATTPTQRSTVDTIYLDEVTQRQCIRAGLTAGQIDVTALSAIPVRGFAVSQITSPRTVLEMLAYAYGVDQVESGGKIKFTLRGASSVATIPYADLGASEGDAVEPLPLVRGNDLETPAYTQVTFANALDDYQDGSEKSDRLVTANNSPEVRELAMVLSPAEAKKAAEMRALDIAARKIRVSGLSLLKDYARLEPTDVITVTDLDGSSFRLRIIKIEDGVVRRIDADIEDASIVTVSATTDETYVESTTVTPIADTVLRLIDGPIARDGDDDHGLYAAVAKTPASALWPGATLFQGQDDAGYVEVAEYSGRTYIGTATTTLGNYTGIGFDEVNSLTASGLGELENYTRDQILNGTAPFVAVGAEWIQYRTATLVSTGVYTLSGLLRGRRGTEFAMSTHAASEQVTLITPAGVRRVSMDMADVGVEFDYRAVTTGEALDNATLVTNTNTAIGRRPFSVVDLRLDGPASPCNVTWKRRTRLRPRFTGTSGILVPLGEESESYVVEVTDSLDAVLSTQTVSAQTAAVTFSATNKVKVYQVSATYGRGIVATLTV